MQIDQLETNFDDVLLHLSIVYSLYSPLLKQKDSDQSRVVLTDVHNFGSVIQFKDEIEEVWHQFFYKIFICPDSFSLNLAIWNWIFDEFLEVLPSYLDKIMEFTDIQTDAEKDRIVLVDKSRKETAYFRYLWSDQLIILVKRAFTDRMRLFGQKSSTTTPSKPWSFFFQESLSTFTTSNSGLKNLTDIKPMMISGLLEKSCQLYVNQFSKLILVELNHRNRLSLRLKELEEIYLMQVFADQINKIVLEDINTTSTRSSVLEAIKGSLTSPLLSESTSKYWSIVSGKFDSANPYDFKIRSKSAWPVNLIITQKFLDNLGYSLQLMNRLFYQYLCFRARTVSCVLNLSKNRTVKFPRRTQNFVLSFRQVLYRLFNCLVKKIGSDIRELQQIVQSATTFNDLEARVTRWHEKMSQFIKESGTASAIISLCNCSQNFVECFNEINYNEQADASNLSQSIVSQPEDLDVHTKPIRQEFVMACESLNLTTLESCNYELTSFEKELSLIVAHITMDKF